MLTKDLLDNVDKSYWPWISIEADTSLSGVGAVTFMLVAGPIVSADWSSDENSPV